jgi:eukaryotic-like serine/threonine-protein kinase
MLGRSPPDGSGMTPPGAAGSPNLSPSPATPYLRPDPAASSSRTSTTRGMPVSHTSFDRLTAAFAGRYRVERELGSGGMATVYLAHDQKHDRRVAVKVLKPELAAVLGAERFIVEIRTTASLQHPHILPLFDSGEADGLLYYVMPYMEGETIRERLDRETQLGVDDAVRIAREVADALDYAHRHGIVHRDIKPENILLHDGRAMVMDFGIALALSAAAGGRMTETGLSLGTPHYMSPEQATAEKEITPRSDIYSLGAVLYEMLAGNPPHVGASAQQIVMKIITEPAEPVTKHRRSVPAHIAAAAGRALEKLPADRFDSARAFSDALGNATFTHTTAAPALSVARASAPRRWIPWSTAGAAVTLAIVAGIGWQRAATPPSVVQADVYMGDVAPTSRQVVLSPDGSMMAIAGSVASDQAIYLRPVDGSAEFRKIAGTEGGVFPTFSPDGRWIAFRRHPSRSLVRVPIAGGSPLTIVPEGPINPFSPHWGTDDQIVFSSPQGTFRVSVAGGTPERLDKVVTRTPFLLPDGSGVLFTAVSANAALLLYDFERDSVFDLGAIGWHPILADRDHILYVDATGALTASRLDRRRRMLAGVPTQLYPRVGTSLSLRGYAISRNGMLVVNDDASWLPGLASGGNQIVMVTIGGGADTLRLPPASRGAPRFSPDGRKLAYEAGERGESNPTQIFTFDLVTGSHTQLTFEEDNDDPVWSPDGTRVLFNRSTEATGEDLFVKAADNSGPERQLLALPGNQWPSQWPREDLIVFNSRRGESTDILLWSPGDTLPPRPWLDAPWNELDMHVSPDGTLAAYTSSERGASEIWLRDFPVPRGKWRVSTGSSAGARWSHDGRHLYFVNAGSGSGIDTVYRARIDRTPAIVVNAPEAVYAGDIAGIRNWDLHPNGTQLVIVAPITAAAARRADGAPAPPRFVLTVNWTNELRRRAGDRGR